MVAVLAVAALGLAGWAALRTPRSETAAPHEATFTDAQRSDAKTKVCAAQSVVSKGVSLNTNLTPPGGDGDATGALAVAANARLSLFLGGQYVLAQLDPATPPELADQMRTFAGNLMDIGAAATSGALNADPAQAARLKEADVVNNKIAELCK